MPKNIQLVEKGAVALLLTFAAGYVDITGYKSGLHAFTAHMNGHTVRLGTELLEGNGGAAAVAVIALCSFLFGSLAGRLLIELGAGLRLHRLASLTLFIEAALLGAVTIPFFTGNWQEFGLPHPFATLAMLAAAMGVQTATITRVGSLTVHTTFITGMMNKFAQLTSRAVVDTYYITTGKQEELRHERRNTVLKAFFILSIWVLYFCGAVTGAWLEPVWRLRALYIPMGIILLALIADVILPLPIQQEVDQSDR